MIAMTQSRAKRKRAPPLVISSKALAVPQTWATKKAINKAPTLREMFPQILSHSERKST